MSPAKETRQSAAEQLRSVDREHRTVDIVASDFSLDSHGTRIDPLGWDLEQFKKNPVICLQHDSWGHSASSGLPIGKALPETVRVESGRLVMRIAFPEPGKFPLADQVFELVADGFLRGISVGFDPQEYEEVEEEVDGFKKRVLIFRKQKLLECSIVTIPSNDNGMVLLRQRAEKLNADLDKVVRRTADMEALLPKGAPAAGRTFRIGETEIEVEVRRGDLAAFEKEFLKVVGYFERKQPVNRTSTKVLAKFFKQHDVEQPADEQDAWERMGEMLTEQTTVVAKADDATATATVTESVTTDLPSPESVETEESTEKKDDVPPAPEAKADEPEAPATDPVPEVTPPEEPAPTPSIPTPPAAEAPQPERTSAPEAPRKRVVHISVSDLRALPKVLGQRLNDEAAEALRRGMPAKDLGGYLDGKSKELLTSLIHS